MSRLSVFDSPLLLGFDHFERVLDRAKASSEGYPPYNIEQLSEEDIRITLAVAGFKIADLEVEIEDNQLVIRGRQSEEPDSRVYIHRGIQVVGAKLSDGLLHLDLRRPIPEPKITKINIESGDQADSSATTTIEIEPSRK